jgi:GntR family transcriptional regulator
MTSLPLSYNPIPLYFQLEEALRKKIASREYLPGQPIPSELQLQQEYGVSRETVRRAINDLTSSGLVTKVRGIGTYVAEAKIAHRIGSIYSSTEEILARGMTPGTSFLEKREIRASEEIRREMGLDPLSPIFKIKRLRLADGEPVAILTSYLNGNLVPTILDIEFKNNSLYRTLEDIYQLRFGECDEVIEAGLVGGRDAKLLGIKKSVPVLVVKRLSYLDNTKVIEKLIALYRSDRFKYLVKLKGRNQGCLL